MQDTTIRKSLVAAIRAYGALHCARAFGVSRTALIGFAADLPRRQGTDAVIVQRAADAFATLEAGSAQ